MSLHKKHYFRLFLIIIATIFYFLGNIQRAAIPGAIFDVLSADYKINAANVAMLGAIFCYIYAFTQLICGLLVDRIGGFRVIAIGSIAFSLGCIIFACSNSYCWLFIARAITGFGAATFYLSTIREIRKYSKDANFPLSMSYMLFIGASGGIIANAPFVAAINSFGRENIFKSLAIFTLLVTIIYLFSLRIFKPIHAEKKVEFSLSPFKEILFDRRNLHIYIFGCTNYSIYYVLQSVIGKKFLEDFCYFDVATAAIILSITALISSCSATVNAFVSKLLHNKRSIIFKAASILSLLTTFSICIFLFFDIHSKILAIILCLPPYFSGLSPLLILTLHLINRYEVSATAVAVQNFCFFIMVGVLGMISGVILNFFEPTKINNVMVYSNKAYLAVFSVFLVLSIIEFIFARKIKDNYN